MNEVYLLLGSNIDPEKHIQQALDALNKSPLLEVKKISTTWRTKAVGTVSDDFLNVAVLITTGCELHCLKEMILGEIENNLGRIRTEDKNAPRTIDLDIIVFNDELLDPDVFELDHLTLPLADLLPDLYSEKYGCTLLQHYTTRLPVTMATKAG